MPREKFGTLTQQMYYILLCLKEDCCGIDIMDKVAGLTEGTVRVGSGTLYQPAPVHIGSAMAASRSSTVSEILNRDTPGITS